MQEEFTCIILLEMWENSIFWSCILVVIPHGLRNTQFYFLTFAGAGTPPYMAGGGGHSPSAPVPPHPMAAPFPYSEPLPPYQTPMSKFSLAFITTKIACY